MYDELRDKAAHACEVAQAARAVEQARIDLFCARGAYERALKDYERLVGRDAARRDDISS